MASHIFISYNREDQHRARAIAEALQAEGLSVWWDSNLRAGESYDEVTEKNLREAGAVVVLWSERSVNSKWVRAEATVGERFSKLVPVMIDECERPLRFELVQTADLTRWHGDRTDPNWRDFTQSVKSALGHAEQAPSLQTSAPPSSGAGDVTIENTFWTSIKDGSERSDFEAYLKRYPDGHFSDLARNRLAALDRAAQQARRPAAPRPQAPTEAAQRQARPPQRQAISQRSAAPQSAAAKPAPAPQQKKSGAGFFILIGVAIVVIGAAAAGYFMFSGKKDRDDVAEAAGSNEETASITPEAGLDSDSAESLDADLDLAATEEATAALDEGQVEAASLDGDAAASDAQDEELALDGTEAAEVSETAADEPAGETAEVAVAQGPGDVFADCDICPQMAILPAGTFVMGSPDDEAGRYPYEGPQHEVSIKAFAIGVHEVTFDQWAACVEDGGCRGYRPGDAGFGRGSRPALYISWRDAQAYVEWLSRKTGRSYRLPTEAEWEYAARGGETSAYWWGGSFDRTKAALGGTVEVGTLPANGFGLHEILGNAGEWVQDCYLNNFAETPTDGTAATSGDCGRRVVRGGSWRGEPRELRSANRSRITATVRDRSLGLRVAADLE